MSEHEWRPIAAESCGCGSIQATYRNELEEEYIHSADYWHGMNPREVCWSGCAGDWPGCKPSCPLFNLPLERDFEKSKRSSVPMQEETRFTPLEGFVGDSDDFTPVEIGAWTDGNYQEEAGKDYDMNSIAECLDNQPLSALGGDRIVEDIEWQPRSTLLTNEYDDYLEVWKGRSGECLKLYINASLVEDSPRLQNLVNELSLIHQRRKDREEAYEERLGCHYYVKWIDESLVQGYTSEDHIHHMRIFPSDWLDASNKLARMAKKIYTAYVNRLRQIWDGEEPDAFIPEEVYEKPGPPEQSHYQVYWDDGSMYEYWEGTDGTQYVNEYRNNRLLHDASLLKKANAIYAAYKKKHPGLISPCQGRQAK